MAGWGTTIGGMADKIMRAMTSYYEHEFATTAGSLSSSATSVAVTTGHAAAMGLTIGDVIEINAETIMITAVSTDTLTISRGWQGTTAAAHAAGDMVRLHPRVSRQDVYEGIESTILGWDSLGTVGYFKCNADFGNGSARSAEVFGAPEEFKEVLKMRFENEDGVWAKPPGRAWVERDITTMSGAGLVLQWESPHYVNTSGSKSVDLWLSIPFDTSNFEAETDLIDEIGMARSMLDVLFFGTMYQILLPEETQRAMIGSSPQPREAQEVPPGYLAQTALSFRVLHDQRYNVEVAKLKKRWGEG